MVDLLDSEDSLKDLKSAVRTKLGFGENAKITFSQIRSGSNIILEDSKSQIFVLFPYLSHFFRRWLWCLVSFLAFVWYSMCKSHYWTNCWEYSWFLYFPLTSLSVIISSLIIGRWFLCLVSLYCFVCWVVSFLSSVSIRLSWVVWQVMTILSIPDLKQITHGNKRVYFLNIPGWRQTHLSFSQYHPQKRR